MGHYDSCRPGGNGIDAYEEKIKERREQELKTTLELEKFSSKIQTNDRFLGYMEGVSDCLNILNTVENKTVDKTELYSLFMELRPKWKK